MFIQKRKIVAEEEINPEMEQGAEAEAEAGTVDVAPEATDLLFEAEDVAQLLAEATGEAVEVTAEEDMVTFMVGEDELVAQAEGDEEVLESCTKKVLKGKRTVAASTKRPVKANTQKSETNSKVIRKLPSKR